MMVGMQQNRTTYFMFAGVVIITRTFILPPVFLGPSLKTQFRKQIAILFPWRNQEVDALAKPRRTLVFGSIKHCHILVYRVAQRQLTQRFSR
jgi:hypothetical protein